MKTKLFIAGLATSVLFAPVASQAFEAKLSGQVNSAVLFGGDVDDTEVVDNNASGSRFRFKASEEIGGGMKAGMRLEFQIQDNKSGNLTDSLSDGTGETRYSDVWVSGNWGKLGIGKGDGAANGTFEAYGLLCYLCGGENVYLYKGALAKAGSPVGYDTIDGTSRENRVRYDSPNFNGFSFAASLDNNDREEIAIQYKGKIGNGTLDFRAGDVSEEDITSASIAYKHDSGFGIAYSDGEKGNSDSDWLQVSYSFGKSDVNIGSGDNDGDDATIFTYRYLPVKGMEIYLQYIDYENESFTTRTNLNDEGTIFLDTFTPAFSGDAMALGSRIKF